MSTKILLPPHMSNRYLFRTKSSKKIKSTHSSSASSSPSKRYKFTSTSPDIYKFPPSNRSQSSDRYYFSLDGSSQSRLTYHSDTPYSFSKVIINESQAHRRNRNIEYHSPTRMDTTTSTNGSLSKIKRSPTSKSPAVHFEPSSLTRRRPKRKSLDQSIESLDKSVDRLVSSVNQKYGQQQISPTIHSSLNYISQYYGHFDERSVETDDELEKLHSNFPTNRIHKNIMKAVHRSLIDRTYHRDKTRMKKFEQYVRYYLRLYERQALQYELNHNLIRCFSTSYLHDLRQDDLHQNCLRSQTPSYTYEDVQDLYNPSIFEAYKTKLTIDREKYQQIQSSLSTGQLSPVSSSDYSPIVIGSSNDNTDTHSAGLDVERRSPTSISTALRSNVDVFYQIMQDHFRNIDASIAGHISKASHEIDTDIDIKSSSSFWSDEDLIDRSQSEIPRRKPIRNQRKLSRFLSTVNRSLLDYPSDLIADFYLSQLNRNMQESVRCIESIARDKAHRQQLNLPRQRPILRSLSAEHLYEVRKEHLRYNQTFHQPTSFTAEDVADIYKRFVLENYKRKIAIELERRRRARQEQLSPEKDLNHARIISPSKSAQTKEIIMGRARRTLANDGAGEIVQHVSTLSPPLIYSLNQSTNIRTDAPDLSARHERNDSIIISHRPQTKIYTKVPLIDQIQVCQARQVQSDTDEFAMAHVEPIYSLNQHEINSATEQINEYLPKEPLPERMTVVITIDQHVSRIEEDIPVNETIQPTTPSIPSSHRANENSGDSGISLNLSHTIEPPLIYNSSITHQSPHLNSILEDLNPSIDKQHARQILDEYFYLNISNTHVPIIVHENDWTDEQVENISIKSPSHIQNAQYKYPKPIEYERACIEYPYDEQVTKLDDDLLLIHHQQRSNIRMDNLPQLENPLHSTSILPLNYPIYQSNCPTFSHSSSIQEIETFLNHFEQSLDHEHHLPLIDQVSVSCALTLFDRPRPNTHRSLPAEWLKSHDEQLVEQWIVEKNIDTIQTDGRQVEILCTNETNDMISQYSPTSDYESDSVEKDNDTVTSTVIIPLTILPSSSSSPSIDTHTRVLSQTSNLLTSSSTPIVPIVSFLNALASEDNDRLSTTKEFLLTLGFGRNSMNEITNFVQTTDQLYRPTWINRSSNRSQLLPTYIQHEIHSISSPHQEEEEEQILHYAIENQIDHDDTALLIYSHRLQHGHDLGENIQGPLQTFFEPSHFHLSMTTETYEYQTNLTWSSSLNALEYQIQENELHHPNQCQFFQPKILAYAHIEYLADNQNELQPILMKLDQPIYIDHYYIQSLYPFPEPYYAQMNHIEILLDKNQLIDTSFLSNFILTKPNKREDVDLLTQLNQGNQQNSSHSSVGVRPPKPNESGPTYERVQMQHDVDVDMGKGGQYKKQSNFTYGNEQGGSQQNPTNNFRENISIHQKKEEHPNPEKIVEHLSEDEKSTSSEEVMFEEWTEEFRCRRIDEYDQRTNQLLRTTIDETSDRIKGDVIKEQYKEKNTRSKGRKSYDVIKEKHPSSSSNIYEEISQPPPSTSNRQWTSEDIYTTEIVSDSSRIIPSNQYDRISTGQYPDQHKQEETVTEEYHVEFEIPTTNQTETFTDQSKNQMTPVRRNSDWRSELKQKYRPPSDDDQYKTSNNGNYHAQRVSVIPTSTQQRIKEVQIKLPGQEKTSGDQRKVSSSVSSSPSSRHKVKEVLVCIARGSSPEKSVHSTLTDEKRTVSIDPQTPKKSSSTDEDSPPPPPKRTSSLATSYEPTYSRVGELKNTFETTTTTTNANTKIETNKHQTSVTSGLTEQRRRMFEEQEWTPKTATERRLSETHTGPSLVTDRISHLENLQPDRSTRKDFEVTPQTSIAVQFKNKQVISSFDSELSGPTKPIYQSTPKVTKQKVDEDPGHESEDELSDPKQQEVFRRRTSKTRHRDFSQSTAQPIESTRSVQNIVSKFNESNMENVLSHVPPSKGKGILIELSPRISQSPTKSNLISDSGVFDASPTASHPFRASSSPSWRQNVSTTIIDDATRSHDNGIYVDSTITTTPRTHRQYSDADQTTTTIQNIDESTSKSTYKYDQEIPPNQYHQQQQRTVRRQLTNLPPKDYENLTNYRSQIPITTQSRTTKPYVVDQVETVETETRVECNVQRTNEIKETTKNERITSHSSPLKKTLQTTTTTTTTDETLPARRVLLNERPQYYQPPPSPPPTQHETQFQPIQRDYSQEDLSPPSPSHTMHVTSLSPTHQVTFGKNSPNEVIAIVRVPELSKSNIYERTPSNQDERSRLHYQRVHASSYRPSSPSPIIYQQRPSRPRDGPYEFKNDYSTPITSPPRSSSYHANLHERNQQQQYQPYRPATRYHSNSLGNLFGSNLEFEIEIEKRPPQQPEQPTSVSLDQASRAIITTSKDGRVSIQNVAAYPGHTVVINSDYHASDRSLNRSSGYYSSDEQSSINPYSVSTPNRRYKTNEHIQINSPSDYRFNQVNNIVQNYSRSSSNFHDAIDQIDALYNNLDVQTNQSPSYNFSKSNRRKQLVQNPNEYSQRFTSTGFQQIPYEQQQQQAIFDNDQRLRTSSVGNLVMTTPIHPSQSLSSSGILTDYGTPGSLSPPSNYSSRQNIIVQQNRLNNQSQIVQRNRTSVKQMKQKSAAIKRRNGNTEERYSDDENDSPLSDNGRSSRPYYFNNYHQ